MTSRPNGGRGLLLFATGLRALVGDLGVAALTVAVFPFAFASGLLGLRGLADRVCVVWGGGILRLFGVDVVLNGIENFPQGSGCLVLFNHQSLFDIPVLYGTLRRTLRFGAKVELFRIPFFGPGMRAMGTLPIARANRSETLRTYKHAESMIAKGFSYALAPEGTRQATAAIGRFKTGPFIFAMGAQAPIVPAVIRGARNVLPKGSLLPNLGRWRRTVVLQLLPAVPTRGLGPDDLNPLMDRVHAAMVDAFARLPDLG